MHGKKLATVFCVVLLLLLSLFVYLYQFAGLKNFLKAKKVISNFPNTTENKVKINNFYGDLYGITSENTYGGILIAKFNFGILIVGKEGIKFFSPGLKAHYQINNLCNETNLFSTNNYDEWIDNTNIGSNVIVISQVDLNKNNKFFLALAYNWFYYLDGSIFSQECLKR